MFKHERFLTKTFGGHTSLTNTIWPLLYYKKKMTVMKRTKNILTKESPFLVLNALLIPFLKKAKGDY